MLRMDKNFIDMELMNDLKKSTNKNRKNREKSYKKIKKKST
jgi:hypothetical protein